MIISTSATRRLPQLCAACARRVSARNATTTVPSTTSTTARLQQLPPPTTTTSTTTRPSPLSHHPRFFSSQSTKGSPPTTQKPLPYYALFPQTLSSGPPPTGPFDIDARALRREYLQLQATAHPDLHHHAASTTTTSSSAQKSNADRADALSSHINAAYKTLASPLARAQYLLAERYGHDLAGDEASALTGPPDPALLAEVLLARETIEDAASEQDLEAIRRDNDERRRLSLRRLAEAFANEDVPAAVRETVRLRYWENIAESIHNWEEGKPIVLQH